MERILASIMLGILMMPSDRAHGGSARKATTARKRTQRGKLATVKASTLEDTIGATSGSQDYRAARPDMDWEKFVTTFAAYLGKHAMVNPHVGALVNAIGADFDAQNTAMQAATDAGVDLDADDLADIDGDGTEDGDFLASLLGPDPFSITASGVRVLPSDPDMTAALRIIADGIDAAWMEQTGKNASAQKNATYKGGDTATS